jgi:hypothetical protein
MYRKAKAKRKQSESKAKAKRKQSESKAKAKRKQSESKAPKSCLPFNQSPV